MRYILMYNMHCNIHVSASLEAIPFSASHFNLQPNGGDAEVTWSSSHKKRNLPRAGHGQNSIENCFSQFHWPWNHVFLRFELDIGQRDPKEIKSKDTAVAGLKFERCLYCNALRFLRGRPRLHYDYWVNGRDDRQQHFDLDRLCIYAYIPYWY